MSMKQFEIEGITFEYSNRLLKSDNVVYTFGWTGIIDFYIDHFATGRYQLIGWKGEKNIFTGEISDIETVKLKVKELLNAYSDL